jgi:hypothetical protein
MRELWETTEDSESEVVWVLHEPSALIRAKSREVRSLECGFSRISSAIGTEFSPTRLAVITLIAIDGTSRVYPSSFPLSKRWVARELMLGPPSVSRRVNHQRIR